MKLIGLILLVSFMMSCKGEKENSDLEPLNANRIIEKAIEQSGGGDYANSEISFRFRGASYKAFRQNRKFELSRSKLQNDSAVFESISNSGYKKLINDLPVKVSDSLSQLYSASINSVHYFSVLPYGLNDKAVNKELLGKEIIATTEYFKIKVTFDEVGGGEDFEDVFLYWVNTKTFKVEYLAYSYNELDGNGLRFRKAYNERMVNGLRFVDYENYKPNDSTLKLLDMASAYESDTLELLSKIELEDIEVKVFTQN